MIAVRFGETIALRLALCTLILQISAASALGQASAATAEPAGPKPSAAVEKILSEASRLAEDKQPADSLKVADQALDAARQVNDKSGEAFAQQARSKALQDLRRKDEAFAAWREAGRLWAERGDAPEEIMALVQAGLLCVPNKEDDAQKFFAQGLSVAKRDARAQASLAQALYDSGISIGSEGLEPEAMDYLNVALSIREKEPESLKMIETLNALAKYSRNRGIRNTDGKYFEISKDYASRAVEIGLRIAPNSSLTAEALRKLANSERDFTNEPVAARRHYLAALQIDRRAVPHGSELQATILRDLALLETNLTNFPGAHEYLDEATAIAGKLAPESLLHEGILENLGLLEKDEGNLPAAREHLQYALEIRERLGGGDLGENWINLGGVALEQYDFASARDYFEKALSFFQVKYPNTSGIEIANQNLSVTYRLQGDFATALEYGQRALVQDEKKLGASTDTAEDLSNIGDILRDQSRFGEATEYYRRSLEMWEKLFPGSLHVSGVLASLATVAREQGDLQTAQRYDQQALEMGQKSCPSSWCVEDILNDLGEVAYEQGDLDKSEHYLRENVELREKSLGLGHPDLARSLNDLAITLAALGKGEEALADALRAENIGADHLRVSMRTLSERQALAYEAIRASGLDLAVTLAAGPASLGSSRSQVFDAVIRSRALVFDELAARHRSAYGSDDPEIKQLSDQLSSARTRLATLVFRGPDDLKPEVYRKLLDDVQEQEEKNERLLAEKSIVFRQVQARSQLGLKEISAALPQGAALLAYVRYARHDLHQPSPGKVIPPPVPSYAAFVLRAGGHEPQLVPLGTADDVDRLVRIWRGTIARQADVPDGPGNVAPKEYQRAGTALRRKLWDPLTPQLGKAKEVFVVPDSALHLVSLAALPADQGRYLIETGPLLHYLSAERDLASAPTQRGQGMLVVGNPAFDQAGQVFVASKQQPPSTAPQILRGERSACGTFQTLHFPPLPASQQEVKQIAALWNQSTGERIQAMRGPESTSTNGQLVEVTGTAASLEAFLQEAPGKRVLHIATHGFFLEGNCESATQRRLDTDKRNERFLPATAENPLLLSGLAFAGANRRASATPEQSDGILTAEEIAGMNLEGVDWAVLSACDTGVGEIKVGEGVFGLRRAFQVAGAKTVIMSLWPVEDESARNWMGRLYSERFLKGKNTAESVRAASLELLKSRRTKQQSTNPFYWGAFIAAGDWK